MDTSNAKAQAVYKALGMNGDHYHVFEDMFAEEIFTKDASPGS